MSETKSTVAGSDSVVTWQGRIVARILPPGTDEAYEQKKPNAAYIDPSTLKEGTGPFRRREASPSENTSTSSSTTDDVLKNDGVGAGDISSNVNTETNPTPPEIGSSVRLDVYLYKDEANKTSTTTTLTASLIRKGDEPVTNCLKRLGIAVSKKLKSASSPPSASSSNGKGKQRIVKGKKGQAVELPKAYIKQEVNDIKDDDETLEEITISSDTTTSEFWNLATISKQQMIIQIPFTTREEEKNKSDDGDDSENSKMKMIPFIVECNVPTILSISTFEKFGSMIFPNIPIVVQTETLYTTHVIIDWYVDKQRVCHDSQSYIPTIQDGGKKLSILVTPINDSKLTISHYRNGKGYEEAYQFHEIISSSLPQNTTLSIRDTWREKRDYRQVIQDKTLRILSYNILADQNTSRGGGGGGGGNNTTGQVSDSQFPYVSMDILKRTRRMPLILYEILEYKADIICLQEVDEGIYKSLFKPVLEYYNYQGYFAGKQQDGIQEGCAMFWSLHRFQRTNNGNDDEEEEQQRVYSLNDLVVKDLIDPIIDDDNDIIKENEKQEKSFEKIEWEESARDLRSLLAKRTDLAETIRTKLGHVLQVVRLYELGSDKPLMVANTHLYFHPEAAHIRTMQCYAIAHFLSTEQQKQQIRNQGKSLPFILCGDLNTSLENSGRLFIQRNIPKNFRDHRIDLNRYRFDRSESVDDDDSKKQPDDDFPGLNLPTCAAHIVSGYVQTPEFTFYQLDFQQTMDHILISSSSSSSTNQEEEEEVNENENVVFSGLVPFRSAEMPTKEQATEHQAMPSPHFPSDHVSVLCDVKWK